MKNTLIKYVALGAIIGSSAVHAGYDRSGQDTSIILADGNIAEIVVAKVTPKVTGTFTAALGGGNTSDVAPDFMVSSYAMRLGISNMAVAVIQDTPYGADVSWTSGAMNGIKGKINSSATTVLVSRSLFGDKKMISKEMMSKHKEMMSKDKEMMYKDKEMMSKDKEMMSKDKEMMSKDKEMMSKDKEMMSKDKKMMSKDKKMMSKDKGMMSKIMSAKSVVTVYGGFKNQSLDVTAAIPTLGYTLDTGSDSSIGYVIGAAFEKPEIALKVSLSYHNKIKHDFTITESSAPAGPNRSSSLSVYTPTAINLDFQTGITANTLIFGTIRRAQWSELEGIPADYKAITGASLLAQGTDTNTYNIGLGRKLSDMWSIAATYGYEKALKTPGSPLSVTDGHSSTGLGATYSAGKLSVTVGVKRIKLGDTDVYTANPQINGGAPFVGAEMRDNTSTVSALKVAYKF